MKTFKFGTIEMSGKTVKEAREKTMQVVKKTLENQNEPSWLIEGIGGVVAFMVNPAGVGWCETHVRKGSRLCGSFLCGTRNHAILNALMVGASYAHSAEISRGEAYDWVKRHAPREVLAQAVDYLDKIVYR